MGRLSITNEKKYKEHYMECVKFKNWHFFGIREINCPDRSWMVATQVIYIPFGLAFWENLKKRDPHIGDMEILLSSNKGIKTPNTVMIELSNISCGGD